MNSLFSEQEAKERFDRIYKASYEKGLINQLYESDKLLFFPNFIDTIIKIGEKNEYSITDFIETSLILQSALFSDYVKAHSQETLKPYNFILDAYFKAICQDLGKPSAVIKNKILTLLKVKLVVPSLNNSVMFDNPTINVTSLYKPNEQNQISAGCDIENILQHNYYNAVKNVNCHSFTYKSYPNTVNLQGPILDNILSIMLSYQELLLQVASTNGIKIEPFIITNNSFKRKTEDIEDSNQLALL